MKVVILCGGLGTRLLPLTKEVPKCMLPINNKPVLEHQIEYLKKQGFTDIILAVGHLKDSIVDYFKDGSDFGVNIEYSYDDCLGTGGAIKSTNINETFIVFNGDTLLNIDINDMLKNHHKLVSMAVTKVMNPDRYGVIVKGKFNEKVHVESGYVSCGMYIIEPEILDYIPPNRYCSLENEIFPNLISLGFYIYEGKFTDMGTHESYEQVR